MQDPDSQACRTCPHSTRPVSKHCFLCIQGQDADSSGSSDEEDFDDDQMFQMDDKIAAALRVMAKGGANARESREAISSFKFRVIGLLDIYVKKVSALAPCPMLVSAYIRLQLYPLNPLTVSES